MSEHSHRTVRKRPRDDYEDYPRTKRGRYSDPGPRGREGETTAEQKLESLITRVGEKSHKSLESNLEALAGILHNEMAVMKEKILQTICKCVCNSTEKTFIYSTLVGLLNAKKYDIGEEFLDLLVEQLKNSLALNEYEKARHLLIFFSDLVNCKVVSAASIVSLFDAFVTVTFEPDIPQVRSDWYVYMVLSALPCVGVELEEKKTSELERLLITIDNYMSKRTTPFLPMFQVWTSEHPHPQRDYLELLWTQVKQLKEKEWKEHVLLKLYTAFQTEIGGAYLHTLPSIQVPNHTQDSTYPLPFAVFRLFSSDNLQFSLQDCSLPPANSIDRFLAEEMVRCIIASHENNRKECATALMGFSETVQERLRLSANYIITEVLFDHILQLPSPPQVLVYYSSVLIELCKNSPAIFPQLLSQTTELLFSRLDKMNSISLNRFAAWFTHHLSNFKYQWDWNTWSPILQGPPDHPSVKFISEVFAKCIRLACYDDFIEMVPESFASLLPAEPMPEFKYSSEEEVPLPETAVATQLLEAIRAKESLDKLKTILETLSVVKQEDKGSAQTKMSVLTHCVLNVGSKTITHCFLALVKFRPLLIDLAENDACKMACLQAVAEFHVKNHQLHTLVVDKLIRMQVVDPLIVVQWLFSDDTTPKFISQYVWDILESTVQKAQRSCANSKKELQETKEKLKKNQTSNFQIARQEAYTTADSCIDSVSDLDEVAMGTDERQDLEGKIDDLEDKVDESEKLLKDVFVTAFKKIVECLTVHLSHCDQEGVDYETLWFTCTLDNCRQLLVKNYGELSKHSTLLEDTVFTPDVDSRVLEVFQQFQALL